MNASLGVKLLTSIASLRWLAFIAMVSCVLGGASPALAAVSIAASSTGVKNVAAAGNFSVTWPAGTTTGDILIVAVSTAEVSGTATCPIPAAVTTGFTQITTARSATINVKCARITTFWKLIGGSDSSPSTFSTSASGLGNWIALRATGVDPTTPIDGTATSAISTALSVTIPAVTTTFDNSLPLEFFGVHGASKTWSTPAGTTSIVSRNDNGGTVTAFQDSVALTPAGSTGTRASTQSGGAPAASSLDKVVGVMFALKAAPPVVVPDMTGHVVESPTLVPVVRGGTYTRTVKLYNDGAGTASNVRYDQLGTWISAWNWSCTASGTATCGTCTASNALPGCTGMSFPPDTGTAGVADTNYVTLALTFTVDPATATPGFATGIHTYIRNLASTDTGATNTGAFPYEQAVALSIDVAANSTTNLSTTNSTATSYVAGTATTIDMFMSNTGVNIPGGSGWTASLPANFTSTTWACTITAGTGACGTASGAGNTATLSNVTLNTGATARIRFTTTATTAGTVNSTSTVTVPLGWTDSAPANNSASITTTIGTPNMSGNWNDPTIIVPVMQGSTYSWNAKLYNDGTGIATGVRYVHTDPGSKISAWSWSCVASGSASCGTCSAPTSLPSCTGMSFPADTGSAGVADTNYVTLNIQFTVSPSAGLGNAGFNAWMQSLASSDAGASNSGSFPWEESISKTISISASQTTDLSTVNNTAAHYLTGVPTQITMTMTNTGSNIPSGAGFTGSLYPTFFSSTTWTCAITTGTGDCGTTSGTGNTATLTNVALNSGSTATLTFTTTPTPTTGSLSNSSSVTVPSGWTDSVPGNNSSTVYTETDTYITVNDGSIGAPPVIGLNGSMSVGQTKTITFTAALRNPYQSSTVNDLPALLTMTPGLAVVSWSCAVSSGTGDCDNTTAGTSASGGAGTAIPFSHMNFGQPGSPTYLTYTILVQAVVADCNASTGITFNAGTSAYAKYTYNTCITGGATDLSTVNNTAESFPTGTATTITMDMTNTGTNTPGGTGWTAALPANFTSTTWTCAITAGTGDCDTLTGGTTAGGSGNTATLANIALNTGATARITFSTTPTTAGTVTTTSSVTVPSGWTDSNSANNTSNVSTRLWTPGPANFRWVSVGGGFTAATSRTIAKPSPMADCVTSSVWCSDWANGDLVVFTLAVDTTAAVTVTPPTSGWTTLNTTTASGMKLITMYKFKTSAELDSMTWNWSPAATGHAKIFAYGSTATTNPITLFTTTDTPLTGSHSTPAIQATVNGAQYGGYLTNNAVGSYAGGSYPDAPYLTGSNSGITVGFLAAKTATTTNGVTYGPSTMTIGASPTSSIAAGWLICPYGSPGPCGTSVSISDLALANVSATPSPITYLNLGGYYTTLRYEFTLTNNGPNTSAASTFNFTAPPGMNIAYWECIKVSGTADCDTADASQGNNRDGTPSSNSISLSNISLANGAQVRFVIRVFVGGALTNAAVSASAGVTGANSDPTPNTWSTTVTATDDASTGAVTYIDEVRQFTGGSANTVTVNSWVGFAQNNDLLLAHVMLRNGAGSEVFNTPVGWIKLGSTVTRGDLRVAIFFRRWLTGDPTSWTFTTTASGYLGAGVVLYRGVGTALPVPFASASRDSTCVVGAQSSGEMLSNTYSPNWNSLCYQNQSIGGVRAKSINMLATGGKLLTYLFDATGSSPGWSSRDTSGLVWRRSNQNNGQSGSANGLSYATLDRNVVVVGASEDQASQQTAVSPQGNPIGIEIALCSGSTDCGGGVTTTLGVATSTPAAYVQGQNVTWTSTVSNSGAATNNVDLSFGLPSGVSFASWSCANNAGGTCGAASGAGTTTTASFTSSGSVTYTFSGTVAATTYGDLTLAVQASGGTVSDPGAPRASSGIASMKLNNFLISNSSSVNLCPSNTGYVDYAITARDSGNAAIANFAGIVNLSMGGYARGDWSQTSASGTLNNGAADDGAGTYTFVGGDGGGKSLRLTTTAAGSGTLTVTLGTVSQNSPTVVTFALTPTAFNITSTDTLGAIAVAGRNHNLRIEANCGATSYTGAKTLKLWLTKDASHPDPANPGRPAVTNSVGAAFTCATSSPTATCPWLEAEAANISVTFNGSGQADIKLAATDVGKYVLNAKDVTTPTTVGASPTLTVRPFGFRLFGLGGSGTNSATGTALVSAGTTFTGSIRAVQWESADDANNDGVPDGGADLSGNAAVNGYYWPVTLSRGSFAPAIGVGGTLGGTPSIPGTFGGGGWAGGDASYSVNYSEVGAFKMRASATGYLNTAGANIDDNDTVWVGRFYPAKFALAMNSPVFNSACGSSYTYLGQAFSLGGTAPRITVTAQNLSGGTTQNYGINGGTATTNWFRMYDSATSTYPYTTGYTYSAAAGTLNAALLAALPSPSVTNNGNGTAYLDFALSAGGLKFDRAAITNAFNANISLGASITDADGVQPTTANPQSFAMGFTGNASEMRWGWFDIVTGTGLSQPLVTSNLSIPLQAQYRDSGGTTQNAVNGCAVTINQSALSIGFGLVNLAACDTAMSAGSVTLAAATGLGTVNLLPTQGSKSGTGTVTLNLNGASGNYCLVKGGGGANYPSSVSANLGYLVPSAGTNPSATFQFGSGTVARGRVMYRREVY